MLITGVKGRKIDIYVPSESVSLFEDFTNSTYRLSKGDSTLVSRFPILPASPGDAMNFSYGKNKYVVKAYDLDHDVPTRGYGLFEIRTKLRPEYQGRTPKELAEARKKVEISHEVETPIILFAFDTSIKPFLENKDLLQFPIIVVECTFFQEEDKEGQRSKHIHWDDLKPVVEQNPQIHFILTHFSMRYSVKEIEDFFKDKNVMTWTN
jgi:ribonuclease Z